MWKGICIINQHVFSNPQLLAPNLVKKRKQQARIICPELVSSCTFQLEETHSLHKLKSSPFSSCKHDMHWGEAQYRSKILQNMEIIVLREGSAFHLSSREINIMKLRVYKTNMDLFVKQKYVFSTAEDFRLQRNGT